MPPGREDRRFRTHFDDLAFDDDLRHASPRARDVARAARERMQLDGVAVTELRRCAPQARDGTQLPKCVKVYLPDLRGPWRMVFEATRDPVADEFVLAYLAFGVGHPTHPWQPSAYRVAHWRLHAAG